ncbi:MAG: 2-C-methyl-D-erythritol 4-phosphate cytidylyltransferase [Acidobacteria bacterium]|nr:2-C-methyl-D-erythritol 4-phosphate cytidylyltransferase [Acidobacteriota bacterium]
MSQSLTKTAAIIAAAGMGHRLGAQLPKALVQLDGITLLERAFTSISPAVDEIIITAPTGYEDQYRAIVGESAIVITGGVLRSDSVNLALAAISNDVAIVLVHDAARALASTDLAIRIRDAVAGGESAVIPALAAIDTIKEVDREGYVRNTPDRSTLVTVQTPQGFAREVLIRAHAASEDATDDAALVEALGIKVKTIMGETGALKITTPEDLAIATTFLLGDAPHLQSGVGIDAHAFSHDPKRPMWLAGLFWENEVGVDGHSDGDVAAHAICDALFAATNLGDLGSNFGTSDPKYAGASGETLLKETLHRITDAGYGIANVSVQIVGNRPKIGPRRSAAIAELSKALNGATVSVSATSTDGLGFTGEGKGISAIAIALVYKLSGSGN